MPSQKIVFIDTNIFVNCAFKEAEDSDLDILEKLASKIESGEILIVIPEIIQEETLFELEEKFKELQEDVKKLDAKTNKTSRLLEEAVEKAKDFALEKISERRAATTAGLTRIFLSAKAHRVPLSDALIQRGTRRSLLKIAPARASGRHKAAHSRDQDAIAFESLLEFIRQMGKDEKECIICTADSDYYEDAQKQKLHLRLIEDLSPICSAVLSYTNPLKMLKDQFGEDISNEELQRYDESFFRHIEEMGPGYSSVSAPPGSVIKGSLQHLYWYSAVDGKRYVFPTDGTFRTWFPVGGPQPIIHQIPDAELATIPIGGNVTYRPGTRLIKIKEDPKIYAVSQGGTLRWLTSATVASTIFGPDWYMLVDEIPDAFFVNYVIGRDISSVTDYDPVREQVTSRLP